MSFDEEPTEHDGADCRECPAYEFCELGTKQGSDQCREFLKGATPND